MLRRALSAHERLERIVLSERGLDGVASGAGVDDRRPGADLRRARRAAGAPRRPRRAADGAIAALAAELRERTRAGGRRGYVPGAEASRRRARAAGRARRAPPAAATAPLPEAWLIAAKDAGPLTELDRLTLHQAVTIVALELLRRRVVDDTERRLAGDVLTRAGRGRPRRAPSSRAGWSRSGCASAPARSCSRRRAAARAAAEEALARAVREEAGGGLVAPAGPLPVRAAAGDAATTSCSRSPRACTRASRARPAQPLPAGAGRDGRARRPAARLPRGALRAGGARARASTATATARSTLATYRDLGSFQLLLSLQDDDALRLFCDSILAPIEDSEGAYGGELMRSLEAFIECNGQWERAAKALFCHRHTLRYRIRRVEELTGRSLDSARDRIDFWLALRGRELVQTERTDMKVGVPTEIKTDEYRVALTPAGVRELVEHGHEVLVQAGAGEGSAIADEEYTSQGARILPDAAGGVRGVRHDRQGQGAAGASRWRCSSRATRCSPTCTWRRTPS